MQNRFSVFGSRAVVASLVAGALAGGAVLAQGMPPPGGGPPPPLAAASAPLSALAVGLSLSNDQKDKIADIKNHFDSQRRQMRPQFGGPGGGGMRGGQGGPGGPRQGSGMTGGPGAGGGSPEMRTLDMQTSASIKAILTDKQREELSGLITELNAMGRVGIPPQLFADLDLSKDQISKIEMLADTAKQNPPEDRRGGPGRFGDPGGPMNSEMRTKVDAVLTGYQREEVAEFRQQNSMGPGGRGGGMRGGRMGGPGQGGGPGGGMMGRRGGRMGGQGQGGPGGLGQGGGMMDGGPGGPDGPGQDAPPPPMDGGAG
jgi:hypothetical protein